MSPYPWHASQWRRLSALVEQSRLPHALLLSGAEGLGVPQFAAALAGRLLCAAPVADTPCGSCRACVLYAAGNHPDLFLLAPEEGRRQISVDLVRELVDFIHLSSQFGRYKIAIVDPADALNRASANGLLKTLEEPPATSLIILCCRQPGRLPITIRSRCQRLDFHRPALPESIDWLQASLSIDRQAAAELLEQGDGLPLAAAGLAGSERLDQARAVMADLQLLAHRRGNPVSLAEKWNGYGAEQVLGWLSRTFGRMIRSKLTGTGAPEHKSSNIGHLQQIADELHLHQLVDLQDLVMGNYRMLTGPYNMNSQALLEEVVVQWQAIQGNKARRG